MKIIYVENVRIPSERAHAYQIVQTCVWLARFGHDVTLVNPARASGKDVFQAYGLGSDVFSHVTLPVVDPLSWPLISKKIAYGLERWFFIRALRRWASSQRANVWYTRDPAMVEALLDSSRKIVLELHDTPDSNPKRWMAIKDRVSAFVVISSGLKSRLIELGISAEKISVAPDGYDPLDFVSLPKRDAVRDRLKIPRSAFVAMYTGTFYPWKGVDLVVRSWQRTPEQAHLVLIGGPEADRARLQSLLDPSAALRVHFIPQMEHRQAIEALVAADVGLLTTSPDFEIGRAYTSPLKQFEYLAAGLPVLASDVRSSHEVLTDEVAMFYAPNDRGFPDTLFRVLNEPAWLEQARRRAPEMVKSYTWEARAHTIEATLERV